MTAAASGLPLVSIIVPVFNGDRYLRESLDSLLTQTYSRIELLVMDDASTDSTPAIIASYGERVKSFRQRDNCGIYANVNTGIAMAQGELVATYHADDVYHPRIVEREVAFLERYPEAGAAFCADIFIDPEGREFGRLKLPVEVRGEHPLPYPVILNALLTYKNRFLRCPSSMVRAAVYRDVGPYRQEKFRNTSDLEMWLRIGRRYSIGILEEYLLRYRQGHGSSAQRYHHLRTEPERFFQIMDLYLGDGGRSLATPAALAAYEAHRAEDLLMRAASHYIRDSRDEARAILKEVRAHAIMSSAAVQRGRLLLLFVALAGLVRAPRNSLVADSLYWRWHRKDYGGRRRPSACQTPSRWPRTSEPVRRLRARPDTSRRA